MGLDYCIDCGNHFLGLFNELILDGMHPSSQQV